MKSEHQRQKAIEKAKKKRADAAKARDHRVARESGGLGPLGTLAPSFATANWAEQGAQVRVAFARETPSGHYAAALLQCDLATGRLGVRIEPKVNKAGWDGLVSEYGGDQTMLELDPLIAAKIVQETVLWGQENGNQPPAEWAAVKKMIEPIPWKECPFEIHVGAPPQVEAGTPAKGGVLDTIKGWFGRR